MEKSQKAIDIEKRLMEYTEDVPLVVQPVCLNCMHVLHNYEYTYVVNVCFGLRYYDINKTLFCTLGNFPVDCGGGCSKFVEK